MFMFFLYAFVGIVIVMFERDTRQIRMICVCANYFFRQFRECVANIVFGASGL